MKKLIVLILAALVSAGFMQSDPDFAEEMRQLKLEARAARTPDPVRDALAASTNEGDSDNSLRRRVAGAAPVPEGVEAEGLPEAKAAPQPLHFAFDDSDFDYYGKEEGFAQLSYDAGVLTLRLKEEANPHGVVHAFPEVERLSLEERNRIYREPDHGVSRAAKRKLQEEELERLRERVNLAEEKGGLEVVHEEAYLAAVVDYYLGALEGFGFEVELDLRLSNSRSYTLRNGTHQATILFTRTGTDIRVRLQA